MRKIAARQSIDCTFLIITTMRFCSSRFKKLALLYANILLLVFDHFNLISNLEEVDYFGPQSFSNNVLTPLGIFTVGGKCELYSNLSVIEKEELQKLYGKKTVCLEPHSRDYHTTHSSLESLDFEVRNIKLSLLEFHDKVSTLTFTLDTFLKEMKVMVVEDVVGEEEVEENNDEKEEEVSKEGEAA